MAGSTNAGVGSAAVIVRGCDTGTGRGWTTGTSAGGGAGRGGGVSIQLMGIAGPCAGMRNAVWLIGTSSSNRATRFSASVPLMPAMRTGSGRGREKRDEAWAC